MSSLWLKFIQISGCLSRRISCQGFTVRYITGLMNRCSSLSQIESLSRKRALSNYCLKSETAFTVGNQINVRYRSSPAICGRMASVAALIYPLLVLLIIRGTEVSAAIVPLKSPVPAKSPLGSIHRNLSTLVEPPEWMTEPLFYSPRVFAADYAYMKLNLKIYIYPLYPDKYSKQFFRKPDEAARLPYGNYASEHYIFRNLYESELRTNDPEKANFFALPFSVFQTRMTIGPSNVSEFVREYMEETVKMKWPYWNRTGGADHFYSTCHDIGVHAAEKTHLSRSAIQIICPADRWIRNYIPTKDFSFPQIWPRYDSEQGGLSAAERKATEILAFWSGSQNSRVRKHLWDTWADDDEILLGGGRVLKEKVRGENYYSNFRKSKYCLHATGRQVHTARIGDAIFFGCVPVILSSQFDLPFSDVVDWREFAVIVDDSDVPNLKTILKSISDETYNKLHKNVEIVRRLFTWNSPPQDYDIFHMIMYELWLRRFFLRPSLDEDIEFSPSR